MYGVFNCYYGPQVMKFDPIPVIRPIFFLSIGVCINGVPLYNVTYLVK